MPRASARETAFGEIELAFPFCEELVDELKTEIPGRHRRWAPDDKVWRVTGTHKAAAVELLLARYPNADIPATHVRRTPVVVTKRPTASRPTTPPLPATRSTSDPPSRLVASISCPRCHEHYEQPIRVTAETSAQAAKHAITPELVAVCPHCTTLAVVAFLPALMKGKGA